MAVNLNKDTVYRTAKPKEKDYTISDGGGLFLFVGANGSKLWRFVYSFSGKRNKIAFGPYPDNTLVQHIVSQSEQAVKLLESIQPLTGTGRYVFPSSRNDGRPMSDGTIRTALKTWGLRKRPDERPRLQNHGVYVTQRTRLVAGCDRKAVVQHA